MYTIVNSEYNRETGISTVTIRAKNGLFSATAKKHPDDAPSEYVGCEVAYYRAVIKSLKAKAKEMRIRINTLKSYSKAVNNEWEQHSNKTRQYDPLPWIIPLNGMIANYQNEINETQRQISAIKRTEARYVEAHCDYERAIANKVK